MPRADGTPTIAEILAGMPQEDPRAHKPWPPEEDCPGCPAHKDGPHKLGCSVGGVRQVTVPVTRKG